MGNPLTALSSSTLARFVAVAGEKNAITDKEQAGAVGEACKMRAQPISD